VTDLERQDAVVQFLAVSIFTVLPRTTNFGRITGGEVRISRQSATPLPQGVGAPALSNFGVSFYLCTLFDAELYRISTWQNWQHLWGRGLFLEISHAPAQGDRVLALPNGGGLCVHPLSQNYQV